jgi:Flp pilus assembly protein TadD
MLNKMNISLSRQKLIVYVILTVITLAIFWQVHQYDFVNIDDDEYVKGNYHVQSGMTLDGISWAFSTNAAGFWHPLTWLSFMFDYQIHGLNAGGYHITNLILHILSTLLLFWLFNRMTGAIWKSAFVAALFAFHPLHVEPVAWIANRRDVLSVFFWMLTLCLYVYYTEKPVIKRYLLVVFCFVCALMSKPIVITLPLILILMDYWPLARLQSKKIGADITNILPITTDKGAQKGNISSPMDQQLSKTKFAGIIPLWQLWEKTPFFVLSAAFSITTLSSWSAGSQSDVSMVCRLSNATVAFVIYLEKMFWPHNLHLLYPFSAQIPLRQVLGAFLLILFISVAVIAMVKRLPYLFVGWLWYAITFLPSIGITPHGIYWMHDHYSYLPSIGISIMLGWGIPVLFSSSNMGRKILFPAGIAVCAILAAVSWQQCGYWKNSIELFSHAVNVKNDNALLHDQLGLALFEKSKDKAALYHFNKAIVIQPLLYSAYHNRGAVYLKHGQYQQALDDFSKTIALNPNYIKAYNNRANIYAKTGQYELAVEDFSEAIRRSPNYISAYYNRGFLFAKLGQYQKAVEDFNQVIILNPNDINSYNNRAVVYLNTGDIESGCKDAQKACAMGVCSTLEAAKVKGLCR